MPYENEYKVYCTIDSITVLDSLEMLLMHEGLNRKKIVKMCSDLHKADLIRKPENKIYARKNSLATKRTVLRNLYYLNRKRRLR